MGNSALGLFRARLELFGVELQEEKLRAIHLLVWLSVAIGLGVAAILVIVVALALFFWQAAGYAGLIGLAVATFAAATAVFLSLRRHVLTGPQPFAETTAEFKKDLECLHREE